MDDIEYLEEYEDLIMPTMKSDTEKNNTDDEDSSSIDQDIFESLFDDQSDDDTDILSKKVDRKLSERRLERESLDSLDMLVRDLGERVHMKTTQQRQSLPSSSSANAASKPKPFTSCLKKTTNPNKNLRTSAEGTPTQGKPQKRVMFAKLPIVNRTTSPSSSSSHATSSSNLSQFPISGRKPISTSRSSSKSSQKSGHTLNMQRKFNRPQPTIVRPEKIQSKDPVEDPLSLENTESDMESLSDISDDSFASLSDILDLPSETNLKANADKIDSNDHVIEAMNTDITTELNASAHISTEGLPEKVTIISDTILSRIDTALLESLATTDSKEAFSKEYKRNDSPDDSEADKIVEEMPLVGNEVTVSETLESDIPLDTIQKTNETELNGQTKENQLDSSQELLASSNEAKDKDNNNETKDLIDSKDITKEKADISNEIAAESGKSDNVVQKNESIAEDVKVSTTETTKDSMNNQATEHSAEVTSTSRTEKETEKVSSSTKSVELSDVEREKQTDDVKTSRANQADSLAEKIISAFDGESTDEDILKISSNKVTGINETGVRSPELSISDLRKILGTSPDEDSETMKEVKQTVTNKKALNKKQNGSTTSESMEEGSSKTNKEKLLKKSIEKDKNQQGPAKSITEGKASPVKPSLSSKKSKSQLETTQKDLNASKTDTSVESNKSIAQENAAESKKKVPSSSRDQKAVDTKEVKSENKSSKESNASIEKDVKSNSNNKTKFKKPVEKESPKIVEKKTEINKNMENKKLVEKSQSGSSSPFKTANTTDEKQKHRDTTPKPKEIPVKDKDLSKKEEKSRKDINETPKKANLKTGQSSNDVTPSSSRENSFINRNQYKPQKKINSTPAMTTQQEKEATPNKMVRQGSNLVKTSQDKDNTKQSEKQEPKKPALKTVESSENERKKNAANLSNQNIPRNNNKIIKKGGKDEESIDVSTRSIDSPSTSTKSKQEKPGKVVVTTAASTHTAESPNVVVGVKSKSTLPVKNTSPFLSKSGTDSSKNERLQTDERKVVEKVVKVDNKDKLIKRNSLPNIKISQKLSIKQPGTPQSTNTTRTNVELDKTTEIKRKVPQDGNKVKTGDDTKAESKRKNSNEVNKGKSNEVVPTKSTANEIKRKVSNEETKGKNNEDNTKKDTKAEAKRKISDETSKEKSTENTTITKASTKAEVKRKVSHDLSKEKIGEETAQKKDTKLEVKRKISNDESKEKTTEVNPTKNSQVEIKGKISNDESKARSAEDTTKKDSKVELKRKISDQANKEKTTEVTPKIERPDNASVKAPKSNEKNIQTTTNKEGEKPTSTSNVKSQESGKTNRDSDKTPVKMKILRNKSNDSLTTKSISSSQTQNLTNTTKETQIKEKTEIHDQKSIDDNAKDKKTETSANINLSIGKKISETATKATVSPQLQKSNVVVSGSSTKKLDVPIKASEANESKTQAGKELNESVGGLEPKVKFSRNLPKRQLRKRGAEHLTEGATTPNIVPTMVVQTSSTVTAAMIVKESSSTAVVDPVLTKKPKLETGRKSGRTNEAVKIIPGTEVDKTKKIDSKDVKKLRLESTATEKLPNLPSDVESKISTSRTNSSQVVENISKSSPKVSEIQPTSTSEGLSDKVGVIKTVAEENADLKRNEESVRPKLAVPSEDNISSEKKLTEVQSSDKLVQIDSSNAQTPSTNSKDSESIKERENRASSPKRVKPSSTKPPAGSTVMTFNEWLARKNISPSRPEQSAEKEEDVKNITVTREENEIKIPENITKSVAKSVKKPIMKKSEIELLKESMSKEMRESGIDFLIQSHSNSPHCVTKRSLAAAMKSNIPEAQPRSSSSMSVRLRREKLNESPMPTQIFPAKTKSSVDSDSGKDTSMSSITSKASMAVAPQTVKSLASKKRNTKNISKVLKLEQTPFRCRRVCVLLNRSIVERYLKEHKADLTKFPIYSQKQQEQSKETQENKGKKRKAPPPVHEVSGKKLATTTNAIAQATVIITTATTTPTIVTTSTTTPLQTLTRTRRAQIVNPRPNMLTVSPPNRRLKPLPPTNTIPPKQRTPSPTKALTNKNIEVTEINSIVPLNVATDTDTTSTTATTQRLKPKVATTPAIISTSTTTATPMSTGTTTTTTPVSTPAPTSTATLNTSKLINKSAAVPIVPAPASGVTPIIENIAPKTEFDEDDSEYLHGIQTATQSTEDAADCFGATPAFSTSTSLLSTTDMRTAQTRSSMATTSNAVPVVISGATSNSLPPIVIDNVGTRLYSFLHPTKYNKSHGCVMLDYCCPNLDGPMTAIDPTRRHAKVDAAVRDLPGYITMETRLVTRAELEADSSALPASIRHKVQRITGSKMPPTKDPTNNNIAAVSVAATTNVTTATSTVTTSKINATTASVPTLLSALQKQLPATTTLTPKTVPISSQNNAGTGTTTTYKTTQGNAVSAALTPSPPIATITQTSAAEMRAKLRTNLKKFDVLLKRHYPRISLLSFNERQTIIESMTNATQLLPRDIEPAIRLLQEYATHMTLSLTGISKISTKSTPTGTTGVLSLATTSSTTTVTTALPPPPPVNTRATTKRNTSTSNNSLQRRSVPIYSSDKTVIGYQVQMVTPTVNNTSTTPKSSASTSFSSINSASNAMTTPPAGNTRRSGVFVINKATVPPVASSPRTPSNAYSQTTAQQSPRIVYPRLEMHSSAPVASIATPPTASSTPIAAVGSVVTRSGGNTARIGRSITLNKVSKRTSHGKMDSIPAMGAPVTISTTSSSTASLPRLPTLTRNPHLPPLTAAGSSGGGVRPIESPTLQKRLTRKTAAANVTGGNFPGRSSNSTELIVVNHDMQGNPLPITDESILPDEGVPETSAPIKSEKMEDY